MNPKYTSAKRRRARWKPKKYELFWEPCNDGILLPRSSIKKIKSIYSKNKIKVKIIDKTALHDPIKLKFHGKLKKEKGQLAIKKFKNTCGILNAPTGVGKTVMGCWKIAKINQPTIICVHTKKLLKQWNERLQTFLGLKKNQIGIIGDSTIDPKPVTIAMMQTLSDNLELLDNYGVLFIDEAHRAPCNTYVKIIESYK